MARSATEITATMSKTLVGNEANLVGYWKFDETSGTTAADSVTSAGHTPHPGMLMATGATSLPVFGGPDRADQLYAMTSAHHSKAVPARHRRPGHASSL